MNKKFLFISFLAAFAFTSCSNDDDLAGKNGGDDVAEGRTAFLSVRIQDAGTLARGTNSADKPFELGTAKEHDVKSADFYFYDEKGYYVAQGSAWNDGTSTATEGDKSSAENIEFNGKTTVILKGLTGEGYPKYVVTVLNKPDGFNPAENAPTLEKMEKLLAQQNDVPTTDGAVKLTDGYFIMSTSSYKRTETPTETSLPLYFVTELEDKNFVLEKDKIKEDDIVNIYVERLAAKVRLSVDDSKLTPVKDNTNVYELTMTIAGKDNLGESGTGTDVSATEKVYVTFTKWGLNATTKNSYMMKNIDPNWTLEFDWDANAQFRSYWGKSYNYGKEDANYPTSFDGVGKSSYTNYFSYNNLQINLGDFAYCSENTNTAGIVKDNTRGAVTSVLLAAIVSSDKDGEKPLDLIHYNTVYFTEGAYIQYVLNALSLNVYTYEKITVGDKTEDKYTQLVPSDVQLVNEGDGYVKLQLASDAKEYYKKTDEEYTKIEDNSTINTTLANFNASLKANAYKGGRMYYNIPIEHLNDSGKIGSTDGIKEGGYGVVRNHVYNLTINSLSGLGKGVYDPKEKIVPDDPKEQKLYYVGADINILSWKIVNQGVDLK